MVAPNQLARQFDVPAPNQAWVTDITYIRTHEGWLYLAVVLDLFSRQIIGWSMQSALDRELVLSVLLAAQTTLCRDGAFGSGQPVLQRGLAIIPEGRTTSLAVCVAVAIATTMQWPRVFSSCSKESVFVDEPTARGKMHDKTCLTISRCSTIRFAGIVITMACHRRSLRSSLPRGLQVSRKSVAIQFTERLAGV